MNSRAGGGEVVIAVLAACVVHEFWIGSDGIDQVSRDHVNLSASVVASLRSGTVRTDQVIQIERRRKPSERYSSN